MDIIYALVFMFGIGGDPNVTEVYLDTKGPYIDQAECLARADVLARQYVPRDRIYIGVQGYCGTKDMILEMMGPYGVTEEHFKALRSSPPPKDFA